MLILNVDAQSLFWIRFAYLHRTFFVYFIQSLIPKITAVVRVSIILMEDNYGSVTNNADNRYAFTHISPLVRNSQGFDSTRGGASRSGILARTTLFQVPRMKLESFDDDVAR